MIGIAISLLAMQLLLWGVVWRLADIVSRLDYIIDILDEEIDDETSDD